MQEIWKDITGYEGIYQVSNLGRVKSLDHLRKNGKASYQKQKGRMLKQNNRPSTSHHNYKYVGLHRKGYYVHRLVAQAFIPNPNNLPYVNHKDGNTVNNCVDNLEWVTAKQNTQHAIENGLMKCACKEQMDKIREKYIKKYSFAIVKKDLDGNVLEEFSSASEIERKYNYNKTSILRCCKKVKSYHTAYGFIWEFKNSL